MSGPAAIGAYLAERFPAQVRSSGYGVGYSLSIVLPALYLPLLAMLIALIFRGVAFEFRFKANKSRFLWNIAFNLGSLVATFVQGAALGAFIQGFQVEGRNFAGGMFDWLTPFAVVCGVALVAGYALLGCTWLIWRSEGSLQNWAYHLAKTLLIVVLGFILLVSIWTPLIHEGIAARWFSWPNIVFLSPVPLITAGIVYLLWRSVTERREVQPFVWSMALFLISYVGLAISVWPYVVPPHITIWDASSPPESQVFLLIGMMFLILTALAALALPRNWALAAAVAGISGYAAAAIFGRALAICVSAL